MMQLIALEAQRRLRGEQPVLVVVTRRKCGAAERALRAFWSAATALEVDAIAMDADDPDNLSFLDQHGVVHVPDGLLFARGVVIGRSAGARDETDACELLGEALRRPRR